MPEVDPFSALLDRARSDEAVRSRMRERWLRRQAEEDALFVGVLRDIAEAAIPVGVRTIAGRAHQGTVSGIGQDFVALRSPVGEVLIRESALAFVRPQPGTGQPAASGERPAPLDIRLVEILSTLAEERVRVAVGVAGNSEVTTGELAAVGADVLTITTGGDARSCCYVALDTVTEVVVLRGG